MFFITATIRQIRIGLSGTSTALQRFIISFLVMVSIVLITFLSNLAIVCFPRTINRDQDNNRQNTEPHSINMTAFFQSKNATKEFIKAENKT